MKALVLCGGLPQIELLKNLRRRGITTVLADMNPQAVGRPYADIFSTASAMDPAAVRELAVREQVDCIMAVCADQVLSVAAAVSEELGLPCYLSAGTAERVSKKSLMKAGFAASGVPSSRHVILSELSPGAVEGLRYPLIVKPVDSYSSKGVRRCESFEELSAAFPDAVAISRTQTAVVEEFVKGQEYSVDVYVEAGCAKLLCVSRMDKISGSDRFVIYRTLYPAQLSDGILAEIGRVSQAIADGFSLTDSPMLIQLIVKDECAEGESPVSVIEFCARTGGGEKFRMIKRATGFDVVDAVAELTLGGRPHVPDRPAEPLCIVNEFLYCEAGVFDRLEGFEELVGEGVISEYFLLKSPGTAMSGEIRSSSDRIAFFTVEADSPETLLARHREACSRIRAADKNGRDILRHDLTDSFRLS